MIGSERVGAILAAGGFGASRRRRQAMGLPGRGDGPSPGRARPGRLRRGRRAGPGRPGRGGRAGPDRPGRHRNPGPHGRGRARTGRLGPGRARRPGAGGGGARARRGAPLRHPGPGAGGGRDGARARRRTGRSRRDRHREAGRGRSRRRDPRPAQRVAGPDAAGIPHLPVAKGLRVGGPLRSRGHRRVPARRAARGDGGARPWRGDELQDHRAGRPGPGPGARRAGRRHGRGLRRPRLRAGTEARARRRRVRGRRAARSLRRRHLRPCPLRRRARRGGPGGHRPPLPRHRPAVEGGLVPPPPPGGGREGRGAGVDGRELRRDAGGAASRRSRPAPTRCEPGWRRRWASHPGR